MRHRYGRSLDWLEEEFSGLVNAHRSFVEERENELDEVMEARGLLALKSEIGNMDLDQLNENILQVRETIASIDQLWSNLDQAWTSLA